VLADGELNAGVSGADVVLEELREICIWQQAASTYTTDQGMRIWNYVSAFWLNCANNAQVSAVHRLVDTTEQIVAAVPFGAVAGTVELARRARMRARRPQPYQLFKSALPYCKHVATPPDVYVNYLLRGPALTVLRMDFTIVVRPSSCPCC